MAGPLRIREVLHEPVPVLPPEGPRRPARPHRPRSLRPALEALEPRVALSLGVEFPVKTDWRTWNFSSDNASSANGMSVVVWVELNSQDTYGAAGEIRAQIYDQREQRSGQEVVIEPDYRLSWDEVYKREQRVAVAMDKDGNFVVAYALTEAGNISTVFARKYNRNGGGFQTRLVTYIPGSTEPDVAMAANGDFVLAYSFKRTARDRDIAARMYQGNGNYLRTISVANTDWDEYNPSIARNPSGWFDIAYQAYVGFLPIKAAPGNYQTNVYLARYTPRGDGGRSYIVANGLDREENPSVAMDDAGNSVVAWQRLEGGDWDIEARCVPHSRPMGPILVVQRTSLDETEPAVAMNRTDGYFVVAYNSTTWGTIGGVTNLQVQEMTPSGQRLGRYILGDCMEPSISIDNFNNYLMTYTDFVTSSGPHFDLRGRFGHLDSQRGI